MHGLVSMTLSSAKPDLVGEPSLKAQSSVTGLPNNKSTMSGSNTKRQANDGLLPLSNYYGSYPGICGINATENFITPSCRQLYANMLVLTLLLPPNARTNLPFIKKTATGSVNHGKSFLPKPLLINSNGWNLYLLPVLNTPNATEPPRKPRETSCEQLFHLPAYHYPRNPSNPRLPQPCA